ncbi:uncharacterized protein LOC134233733 [Saccostrea cucullata]|uniref:uncharacterized protein LOC134233733 n=1 Tax=Saccostrea cuccullata TaxID=36930 RepID=UPI002ED20529
MLTRTGTVIRKNRRRSSGRGTCRRGSAPTVLQAGCVPPSSPRRHLSNTRTYLTPQPSPSKSVAFSFESERKLCYSPDILSSRRQSSNINSPCDKPQYYGSFVLWTDPAEGNSLSVYVGLVEACDEAGSPCDFVHRAFIIFGRTVPATVFLGLLLALPVTMIIIGVKYLEECPREPKIPIYLLVGGCFGGLKLLMLLCKQARKLRDDDDDTIRDDSELMTLTKVTHACLTLFLCIWFVFGNFWLFRLGIPKFTAPLHEPKNWCDRMVFNFTLWQIVICHILLGVMFIFCVTFCLCFTFVRYKKDIEKG